MQDVGIIRNVNAQQCLLKSGVTWKPIPKKISRFHRVDWKKVIIYVYEMFTEFFYPMQIELNGMAVKRWKIFFGNIICMIDKL